MNDYDFNSELDAILAEFSADGKKDVISEPSSHKPAHIEPKYSEPVFEEPEYEEQEYEESEYEGPEYEESEYEEPEFEETSYIKSKYRNSKPERSEQKEFLIDDDDFDEDYDDDDEYEDEYEEEYTSRDKGFRRFAVGSLGTIFAFVSVFLLFWVGVHIHPDTQLETSSSSKNPKNIVTNLDTYSNNAKADALGDLASYRKKYTISEDALFGPVPNQECYGEVSVANAAEVLSVIQRARDSGLLGADEAVAFDPNVEFYNDGSNIRYYYDETILVILWKEMINGRICSNAEVKIADASQFRRKLADDTYQTAVQYNCSQLASSANAVVAMNADFFAFRDYGITVYQRTVYRDNPNMVDTCYITKSGDMIYSLKGELPSMEAAQQFVDENNVLFSLAFGPILIYDGVTQYCETYPMGEIDKEYSRAGIGQLDERHYLYMTVNHAVEGGVPRCNVNEFAEIFATQNVKTAYNLDGGQTSEINICGDMYNRVDWGNERPVSDIIYFATAIDETEVG